MKVIIIGGTSGIGLALAKEFAAQGHAVAITGRRENLLEQAGRDSGGKIRGFRMDVTDIADAQPRLLAVIREMGGADIIVLNAGWGDINTKLDWSVEEKTIQTNVLAFAALAVTAYKYFADKGAGTLAGISSVAAVRGSGRAPAYGASKIFVSNYLESLRHHAAFLKLPVKIVEIRPGFVRTGMMKAKNAFWVAEPPQAAKQIYRAILRGEKCAYVTARWRLVAWLIRLLPDFIYDKI
jgi:short-subunit dehydrogenase